MKLKLYFSSKIICEITFEFLIVLLKTSYINIAVLMTEIN